MSMVEMVHSHKGKGHAQIFGKVCTQNEVKMCLFFFDCVGSSIQLGVLVMHCDFHEETVSLPCSPSWKKLFSGTSAKVHTSGTIGVVQ